jgi:P63C domain
MDRSAQSRGGRARAQRLSPEARSEIARDAARTRWADAAKLPKATHRGVLEIGEARIPCAVLDDGRRVITEHGITQALGSRSGASKRIKKASSEGGAPLPIFLAPSNLKSFVASDLIDGPLQPVQYRDGRRVIAAFDASALPAVCDVWLRARDAGALQSQQLDRAYRAEVLMRGLAHVGIVALVDEATGFQEDRDRDALHRLLAMYLSEERLAWAKRFPDEFYKQLYRLRGWSWPTGPARTPFIGKITNKIVYERLPEGVLGELQKKNPTEPGTGRRKWKHHQFLSEDIGQPDLRDHLLQLIAIMRISKDWRTFERHFEMAFPLHGTQIEFDLEKDA